MPRRHAPLSLALLVGFAAAAGNCLAEPVDIVVGAKAPALERHAAEELAKQFARLFKAEASVRTDLSKQSRPFVLLGTPASNSHIAKALGEWPELSDQGILLKSVEWSGRSGVVVGGGDSPATLWAAYELGHHFGVRYLLREDIYPDVKPLDLSGVDRLAEPTLRTRTWRTINDFAHGPESWSLTDIKKLLGQLSKLKFNDVMLSVYPWQPFVHYEYGGIEKRTALNWFGEKYRVNDDIPARTIFRGQKVFENPDLAGKTSYKERTEAGTRLLRGVIDEAHRLGMTIGISISPVEFPTEFAPLLPGARPGGLKQLTISPSAQQDLNDERLRGLIKAKVRGYLTTYPKVDRLFLTLPEMPAWEAHVRPAWETLVKRIGGDAPKLEDLISAAANRPIIASKARGRRAIKGNIVTLALLNDLFDDGQLLRRPGGKPAGLVITSIDPELYPFVDRVTPKGSGGLHFLDYTARRVDENRQRLNSVPAKKSRSQLILTLADDNVGVLSQSCVRRLDRLVHQIHEQGWDGFTTRYWDLAELDPSVVFLSRFAYDSRMTARKAHDELFLAITGKQAAADRLWLAFGHIESATEIIDKNQLGFGFPVRGMMMKHYRPVEAPKWWDEVNEHYTQAMIELYRSNDAANPRCRRQLFYWAKRSEYVLDYLSTVKSVREAAIARKAGDNDLAIEKLEAAVESMYNAIDTLGDIAQDQSDRGLVAVLCEYAYRPLVAELDRLSEAE